MASCMECIHFNPCNMHGNIIVEKPTEGNDWGLHNKVENECKYFVPTADVVEVVRCENCTRRVDHEGIIMCNKFGHKFQGEWYGLRATTKDHFCSYGERKGA